VGVSKLNRFAETKVPNLFRGDGIRRAWGGEARGAGGEHGEAVRRMGKARCRGTLPTRARPCILLTARHDASLAG